MKYFFNITIKNQSIEIFNIEFNTVYTEAPELLIGARKKTNNFLIFALGNETQSAITKPEYPKYQDQYDFKIIKPFAKETFSSEYFAYYIRFFIRKMYHEISKKPLFIEMLLFGLLIDNFNIVIKFPYINSMTFVDKIKMRNILGFFNEIHIEN